MVCLSSSVSLPLRRATEDGPWRTCGGSRLDEVVRHFEELEDPRCSINRKHPLVSVVVIAVMAVLAGASGPTAIARWAALKEEFLVAALDLPDGRPGQGCLPPRPDGPAAGGLPGLLRQLAGVAPRRGRRGHRRGAARSSRSTARRRGGATTARTAWAPCIRSRVWASEFGLSLGQVACAEKSNEITAIPEVLRLVDIKGAIITIDAMGAQKAIADADHRRRGGLRAGAEGEPGDAASGGHRLHRRAARGRAGGGAGARDGRDGARPRGDADVSPTPGPRGPAGVRAVEGA